MDYTLLPRHIWQHLTLMSITICYSITDLLVIKSQDVSPGGPISISISDATLKADRMALLLFAQDRPFATLKDADAKFCKGMHLANFILNSKSLGSSPKGMAEASCISDMLCPQ